MLTLPIHSAVTFVLVHPHYPENVGAAARAIKTMGFSQFGLVKPGRLAVPEHEMAQKMAVKSRDVLDSSLRFQTLAEAVLEADWVVATTSRRGVSGVMSVREVAREIHSDVLLGRRICVLFGNEKTGLSHDEVEAADRKLRIPIAADQPSINLAQAVQITAYEFFVAGLDWREQGETAP